MTNNTPSGLSNPMGGSSLLIFWGRYGIGTLDLDPLKNVS
jgi:hypothetical protein